MRRARNRELNFPGPRQNIVSGRLQHPHLGGSCQRDAGFLVATFFGMLLVYCSNTWPPKIMRDTGYDLGPSILFLGVFALASSLGRIALGWRADRIGRGVTIMIAFGMGLRPFLPCRSIGFCP